MTGTGGRIADIQDLLAIESDVKYSDCHLRRKFDGYGLEPVPTVDAYRWPAVALDEPAARHTAALNDAALLAGHPGGTHDTTV